MRFLGDHKDVTVLKKKQFNVVFFEFSNITLYLINNYKLLLFLSHIRTTEINLEITNL